MNGLLAGPAPAELVKLLAVFSYKPRWSFELVPADSWPGTWALKIRTWVQDVRPPHNFDAGYHLVPVPPAGDEVPVEYWRHWLHDKILHVVERHEVDEWFTVDGQRPYDPHAGR